MSTLARLLGATLLATAVASCGLIPLPDGQPGTLPPTAAVLALAKYGTYPGTTPTAFYAHSAKWFSTQATSGSTTMTTEDDTDVVQNFYRDLAKRDGWTFYELATSAPEKFCHLTRGSEYVQASIKPQARKVATPTPGPNDNPADPPKRANTGSTILLFVMER